MRDFDEVTRHRADSKIIKRLLVYAKPYTKNFIISFILMIFDVILSSATAALMGTAVWLINSDMSVDRKYLFLIGIVGIFVASLVIVIAIIYFSNILLQSAGQKIVKDVRVEVFEHIEK